MRLDKFLSHMGIGTRSQVKQIVKRKRVSVNGKIVQKSDTTIDEKQDVVVVDGQQLVYETFQYIMLHKPKGVISATEDKKHRTVLDLVPTAKKDVFPVGRLDIDTEGLLLLTNNGQLAHDLLSPRKHVDKVYYVELESPLTDDAVCALEKGVIIDGKEQCLPAKLKEIQSHSCHIIIQEGKYHQVKRMFRAVNNKVVYLKRLSMGNLVLDESLPCGAFRPLNDDEIRALFH